MAAYSYPTPCDMPFQKYQPFRPLDPERLNRLNRTWPDRQLTQARCGAVWTCATATRP